MILQKTNGLDCETLGQGVLVKLAGKYSMRPVLDDAKRVVGALFGPAWALPVDGVRAFAERVLANQRGTGRTEDAKVNACYFGWLCPYATVAYVTKDMGSARAKAQGQWSFLADMLPPDSAVPRDLQRIVTGYGSELNARITKGARLMAAADAMVSAGKAYKIAVLACTPEPLSRAAE